MYSPSEDTYFMEDILANYRGKIALEVGIGSGYLTRLLCTNFEFVVGTDIDVNSIIYAKNNTSFILVPHLPSDGHRYQNLEKEHFFFK